MRAGISPEDMVRYMSQRDFGVYMRYLNPKLEMTSFHRSYYKILDKFAKGEIKRLIVSAPPQSGKSEASSRGLPAFLLGRDPNKRVVIGSYNTELARSFNADVQRRMMSEAYKAVFPGTRLSDGRTDRAYKCNADTSECVGYDGSLRVVGRSKSLTGWKVDVMIMDDLYKDFNEASSPIVRNKTWKWYTSVVLSRLQDWGQQLIVFTRWHEDDLIGRIKENERVVEIRKWEDFDGLGDKDWAYVNFPAIKVGAPTEIDPREDGEVIFPSHRSLETLLGYKKADPFVFECLYQGNPMSEESKLYGTFKVYTDKSEFGVLVRKGCCIDVAGKGGDDTCSICYEVYRSSNSIYNEQTKKFEPILFVLVTDILLSTDGVEVTSITIPQQINIQGVQVVWVERNAGGEQFGLTIAKKVRSRVEFFYSETNKEARIIGSAGMVMQQIIFPLGWESKYPKAYKELSGFTRVFRANAHDDVPDVLSTIVQKELMDKNAGKPYRGVHSRGIRRAN